MGASHWGKDAPAGSRADLPLGLCLSPATGFLLEALAPYPYLPETQLVLSDY